MRTILISGCARDWPEYLNSDAYKKWLSNQHTIPEKKKDGESSTSGLPEHTTKTVVGKGTSNPATIQESPAPVTSSHSPAMEGKEKTNQEDPTKDSNRKEAHVKKFVLPNMNKKSGGKPVSNPRDGTKNNINS